MWEGLGWRETTAARWKTMNQRAVSAAGRELLSEDDALRVYEEIERAKNRAFYVGQYLGLHVADVESICTQEKEARDQLYKVLLQTAREAKLTWERVAVALRQPLVALPLVAQRIEETHCRGSSVPTLPRTAPEQSTEHQRATELEQMSVGQQRRGSTSARHRKSLELSHPPNIMVVHSTNSSYPPFGQTTSPLSTTPPITPPYNHPRNTSTHVTENVDLQACLTVYRYASHPRQKSRPPPRLPPLQSGTRSGMATDI